MPRLPHAEPPIGPFAESIPAHTHHKLDSTGSQCVACHMPLIEETLGSVKVHAHTFRFITPAATQTLNVPNPCTLCHTDKTVEWAEQTLSGWTERSPWRMGNEAANETAKAYPSIPALLGYLSDE